jgi:hypothetical protein
VHRRGSKLMKSRCCGEERISETCAQIGCSDRGRGSEHILECSAVSGLAQRISCEPRALRDRSGRKRPGRRSSVRPLSNGAARAVLQQSGDPSPAALAPSSTGVLPVRAAEPHASGCSQIWKTQCILVIPHSRTRSSQPRLWTCRGERGAPSVDTRERGPAFHPRK